MAGSIPVGSLVTDIKLNGDQPVKTLKELKQAVSGATSAWRAQEAVLKSAGQSTEAAKAKYQGLSDAVKNQQKYIEGLINKQKDLKKIQAEADTTTEKGKQAYKNATEEIKKNAEQTLRATSRLESLSKQQEKAKNSLKYYSSGLAEAQKNLKQTQAVTRSYVERLKAEGKGYESAKAKLDGYKSSLSNLNKQQKIQEQELSRIASESGKSSDAYKRQEVRVNQTATSIAKLNGKVKSAQSEVNKLRPDGFNRIANGAKHVTNAADKMKAGLKGAWDHIKSGATAAAAGIGAVGAAAVSGAKKAGNLEQSYKEITNLAVTGGEKQKEAIKNVSEMQRQGRNMSIQYGKSQQSIAEAFEELVKRGYSTKQALGAMRTELQGSVASGDDFKDVVAVSSTTLESFGMRANTTAKMTANTKRAVNELAYAADMTSTGFKDLGYGMSYVGSSAHSAEFGLSEIASAMGILSNNGLEASKAGTGLNEVINRLSVATGNLLKGDKKNALAKLGIKPKEITNSTGKLKDLSTVFGVINKHMQGMSKVQKINIMKSLFGMTGEQAGLILAKYNKQLGTLSKQTLKAGKDGDYVAKLSAKNSQTAKMQMARLKEAGDAFTMTLGAKMLPAINKAGDELVVFLTKSKDGKRLTNDFAKGVGTLSNGLVKMIEWIAHHQTETKLIATGLGATYGVVKLAGLVQWLNKTRLAFQGLNVISHTVGAFKKFGSALKASGTLIKAAGKGISFAGKTMGKAFVKQLSLIGKGIKGLGGGILKAAKAIGHQASQAGKFLGEQISKGFKASINFGKGLFGKGEGAGKLNGLLQSARSAGGFKNLSTAGKVGTGLASAGVAINSGIDIYKAVKDKAGSRKQYQDVGKGVGSAIGGGIGLWFAGPMGAAIGSTIGSAVGKWGGNATKNFQNGWNRNKPPKKFWSLENMGYSAHNMWSGFAKGVSNTIKWFRKNWKEIGLYFVNPIAGALNSLYKHNAGFRKWVNNLVKDFKNAWKGIGKWFSNIGKSIQKSWKGMTKFFSNLGKSMAKGLKSAWKGMTKWFSTIGKGIQKSWRSMVKWFSRLGTNMAKGLKSTWRYMTKWFSNIAKGIQRGWRNMTSWFSRLGKNAANGLKSAWRSITKWFSSIYKGVQNAWHGLTSWFSKLGSGAVKGFKSAWHGIIGWFKGIIDGIKSAWDGFWDKVSGPIKTIQKLFSGKLKIGSLHLAAGTDWRKRYGIPAVVNDAPGNNYREGLIDTDGSVSAFPDKRNLPFWLLPGQDIINAHDMAKIFGRGVHLANGTVNLRKLNAPITVKLPDNLLKDLKKITKNSYDLSKKKYSESVARHAKQKQRHDKNDQKTEDERKRLVKQEKEAKDERAKIEKAIKNNLAKGKSTKGLVKQFNALDSRIGNIRKSIAKTKPHYGMTLVDEGLLIGAKSRIGKSKWISDSLFKKLIDNLKKKKRKTKEKKTKKRKTKRKKSTRRRRSYSSSTARRTTRLYSSRVSIPRVSSQHVTVRASVSGLSSIRSLARAIRAIKSKSIKITAKASSVKNVNALAKSVKKIKGGTHKVTVKTKGVKSLKTLYKYTKRIKGKTHKVTVKTSGSKSLKSLESRISAVTKKLKSLDGAAKKSRFGKDIAKQAENAVKSLRGKGNFAKQFESMTKKFDKDLKSMTQKAKKEFNSMWSAIEKSSNSGKSKTLSILSSFSRKFTNDWKSLDNGVHRIFSKFWSRMSSVAGHGVNAVIRILNSAIGKIDSVISNFGGSKSAVNKVGLVHYATGTGYFGGRRPISKPTLAVLNDGNDSPETQNREGIYNKQTGELSIVNGRNVPVLLDSRHEVFNASEMRDLGFTHYATGTGYLKRLYDRAKHYWNNPTKTGKSMFDVVSGLTGAIKELANGMKSKGENQGVTWWSQLWKMAEDKVNDDDLGPAKGLLKAVEKLGKGTTYSQARRYGPDSYDCSGLVSKAMNEYYHKNWGALTVETLWPHAHEISKSQAKPGDPIFWLPNYHVGVYAGHGMYYSAFSPNAHPQVGMHSIAGSVPGVKPTYARFNGTNTEGTGSDGKGIKIKANGSLQRQIKNQVGSGFWKTIQRIADKFGESSIPGTATPEQASRVIRHAMEIAGVSGSNWLHGLETIAAHESSFRDVVNTWDSNARAGHPSAGWFQMIQPTFETWHKPGYDKWRNPLDQAISTIRYIKGHYGGINNVPGIVSLRNGGPYKGYANGGIANMPSIFGEAGPEMAIPLIPSKSTRAWELIGKAVAIISGQNGFNFGRQQQINNQDEKETREFRKEILLLLNMLVNKSNVADIKLTTPNARTLWEVVEPFSKAEQRSALIKLRRGLSGR